MGDVSVGPQRSKSGANIYRSMRDVRPGGVVLHLTDNQGFTGLSLAAGSAEEFQRILRYRVGGRGHRAVSGCGPIFVQGCNRVSQDFPSQLRSS